MISKIMVGATVLFVTVVFVAGTMTVVFVGKRIGVGVNIG